MKFALGEQVSFLLGEDLWFCGRNEHAYCVNDTNTDHVEFTPVRFDPACGTAPPVHVSVGAFCWAVAFKDGSVLTQGLSVPPLWYRGPNMAPESMLHLPAAFEGDKIVNMACGEAHVLVVTSSGNVYARGANVAGQLGIGNKTNMREFAKVEFADDSTSGIKSVACGSMHSLALAHTGELYAWGSAAKNQLGVHFERVQDMSTPIRVGEQKLRDVAMVQVSAGNAHNAVVDRQGALWVWGNNMDYQLGTGDRLAKKTPYKLTNEDVFAGEAIKAAACGYKHTLVVSEQGGVWAWGNGMYGKLGTDTTQECHSPRKIDASVFQDEKVQVVAAGYEHSACITESRRVYTWGRGLSRHLNSNGTVGDVPTGLGHDDDEYVQRPRWVSVFGEQELAFAMCMHPRLGEASLCKDLCPETVAMIWGHVR
jgi:alpha-tubulin suppressor-like RCC1 family protein